MINVARIYPVFDRLLSNSVGKPLTAAISPLARTNS